MTETKSTIVVDTYFAEHVKTYVAELTVLYEMLDDSANIHIRGFLYSQAQEAERMLGSCVYEMMKTAATQTLPTRNEHAFRHGEG